MDLLVAYLLVDLMSLALVRLGTDLADPREHRMLVELVAQENFILVDLAAMVVADLEDQEVVERYRDVELLLAAVVHLVPVLDLMAKVQIIENTFIF